MSEEEFDKFVDAQFDDHEPVAININTVIQRQMAWDMFPCAQVEPILEDQGFIPGTKENAELEHQEAHARLAKIEALKAHIFALGGFAGELLFLARVGQSEMTLTDAEKAMGVALYQDTVRAGVVAVISELVDFGILQLNTEAVDVRFLD